MRESASVRLPALRVRMPPAEWISISCEGCVSSGTGICEEPTIRPEESHLVC